MGLSSGQRRSLRVELFREVTERLHDPRDRALLSWLGQALSALDAPEPEVKRSRAWFGPPDPMVETLVSLIDGSRRTLAAAVFTITDDRVSEALIRAHRRGVAVRILTDGDKTRDPGSDARRLQNAGIPLAMDRSEHHFHHKFAVFDAAALLNGSYNWTRGADRSNRENFLLTFEVALVRAYQEAFEEMWADLYGGGA